MNRCWAQSERSLRRECRSGWAARSEPAPVTVAVRVKCAFVAWFVECLRGFTYLLFQFSQNTINESSLLSPVPYSVSGCAERRDIETDDASCS